MNPIARLRSSIHNHGIGGTLRLAAGMVTRGLAFTLQNWWATRYLKSTGRKFDRRYHVNTCGWIDGKDLDGGGNVRHATAYAGVAPKPFRMVMDQLGIKFEKYHFIDFGSGKGRALLLASEYPFAKIIGVELSPSLNEIAQANRHSYRNPAQKCKCFELHCADATQFEIPADPVVLFFFNPFGIELMQRMADRVKIALEAGRDRLLIVYFWPTAATAWEGVHQLRAVPIRQPEWAWPAHRGRQIVSVWKTRDFDES